MPYVRVWSRPISLVSLPRTPRLPYIISTIPITYIHVSCWRETYHVDGRRATRQFYLCIWQTVGLNACTSVGHSAYSRPPVEEIPAPQLVVRVLRTLHPTDTYAAITYIASFSF